VATAGREQPTPSKPDRAFTTAWVKTTDLASVIDPLSPVTAGRSRRYGVGSVVEANTGSGTSNDWTGSAAAG